MKQKNYKPFLFLLLIFIVPILASGILFQFHQYAGLKTKNHGILINPPVMISGELLDNSRKWQIVYVTGASCDQNCENILQTLHQVKKALGKNTDRVVVKKTAEFSIKLEQLTQNNIALTNKIYLIDPANNVFMYYPDTNNPMDILKDLKHVLEVSQIG